MRLLSIYKLVSEIRLEKLGGKVPESRPWSVAPALS